MNLFAMFLQQNQPSPEMIQRLVMTVIPLLMIGYVVIVALVMVPCWFILKKAGFSPWLALLCIVPSLGTLVLLYILAFADWKVVPLPQVAAYPPAYPPPPPPPYPPQA